MRRPAAAEKTLERIRRWREMCPDLAIRSTFIVGFPGETEDDFEMLLDFVREAKLARVGCFRYEPVEGAKANDLPGAVPDEVKEERWHRFMEVAKEVSAERLAAWSAARSTSSSTRSTRKARSAAPVWDAPEIDGSVFLNGDTDLTPGDIVRATHRPCRRLRPVGRARLGRQMLPGALFSALYE